MFMRLDLVVLLAGAAFAVPAQEICSPLPWLDWFALRVPPGQGVLQAGLEAEEAPPLSRVPAYAAPVPWLDWAAEEMAFALAEAEPADGDTSEAVEEAEAGTSEPVVIDIPNDPRTELIRVRREMQSLRSEVRMLQATLETFMTEVAAPLRQENEELRAEVQRIYALQQGDPEGVFPTVPRPGEELVEQVINEAVERAVAEQAARSAPMAQAPPEPEFTYTIISEYGREPDNPSVLDGEAPSLKGMVIVVPRGSYREDIVALGKELRTRFERYDNINIEVFDETLAAQSFAETNVSTGPEHRVLSVSRHKASGRDAIIFLQDGIATEVE